MCRCHLYSEKFVKIQHLKRKYLKSKLNDFWKIIRNETAAIRQNRNFILEFFHKSRYLAEGSQPPILVIPPFFNFTLPSLS